MKRLLTTYIAAILLTAPALLSAAQDVDQLLAPAHKAYESGVESGNKAVRELIERNPGNIQLALIGLRLILNRSHHDTEWNRYASSSLLVLKERGVLALTDDVTMDIYGRRINHDKQQHRLLSARLLRKEFFERYPLWEDYHGENSDYRFVQLSGGSPMDQFAQTRFDEDRWDEIRGANLAVVAETIDKRIEKSIAKLGKSRWEENAGYLEDWTVLDMHLRSQPADKLGSLRAYQEKKLQEDPGNLTADALSVFRRFPWAETAHRRLLGYADADLARGHLQAAYRSFDDVRIRTANANLRKRADHGCKLSLSNTAKVESQAPDLASLKIQTVAPPPILPWRIGERNGQPLRPEYPELQVEDGYIVLSGRRYLAAYGRSKTDLPKWIRTEENDIGQCGDSTPGSYSPALIDGKVYARNLGRETAAVMNVIDLAGGTDLWGMGRYKTQVPGLSTETPPALNDYQQFLSKPVLVDGLRLYLSYELGARNPRMYHSVVAVDVETRNVLWRSLIKMKSDERPRPHPYGIPPIVHKGFVYAVSSHQTVSCHDLRDGRLVWVHQYSIPERHKLSGGLPRYAASPVVAGKRLICTPLDTTTATFALDLGTGRTIWSNPDVYAVEQIGGHGDTVLVRDELTVAALSVEDGKMRWGHRFEKPIIGRVQLIGDRLYVPTEGMMAALSAGDGTLLGKRLWESKDGPPQAVRIDGDRLFIVGNIPYLDPAKKVLNMAAPKATALKLPLHLAWSLPADGHSRPILPPPGSPLSGKMYYVCAGVLTCAEANPQGGILWQRFVRQRQRVLDRMYSYEGTIQPMFFGEVIVLRGSPAFTAFNGRTGERLWSRNVYGEPTYHVGDYILVWTGSNSSGRAVCLDFKTGKIRWEKTLGHGSQAFAQANAIHFFQRPHGKPFRHLAVHPRTGATIQAHEDIVQELKGRWWNVIRVGTRGALLGSSGQGKQEYCFYKLDGKKPKHWRFGDTKIEYVIASNEKYVVVKEQGNQLAVYKFEDDGYRATPLAMAGTGYDRNNMYFDLEGERLICVYRGNRIILFDLQAKKVLHDSHVRETERLKNEKDAKKKHKGAAVYLLRDGNRLFVEMRPPHWLKEPAPSYFLDLQTGKTTDATGSMLYGGQNKSFHGPSIPRYSNGLIMKSTRHMEKIGYVHAIQCWSPAE